MNLLLLNPNSTRAMTEQMVEAAETCADVGTTVVGATLSDSPPSLNGYYDSAMAAAGVARFVASKGDQWDAVIIACFDDPGLFAAREVLDIPVVGIGEASFYFAMATGHRFGVITTDDRWIPGTLDAVRRNGLEGRCAAIEACNTAVLDLVDDPLGSVEAIVTAGRHAIAAGAEVLCLGCGGMLSLRLTLEERLGVPIVEAVTAGVLLAESLVRLQLRTSKARAFAWPLASLADDRRD